MKSYRFNLENVMRERWMSEKELEGALIRVSVGRKGQEVQKLVSVNMINLLNKGSKTTLVTIEQISEMCRALNCGIDSLIVASHQTNIGVISPYMGPYKMNLDEVLTKRRIASKTIQPRTKGYWNADYKNYAPISTKRVNSLRHACGGWPQLSIAMINSLCEAAICCVDDLIVPDEDERKEIIRKKEEQQKHQDALNVLRLVENIERENNQ